MATAIQEAKRDISDKGVKVLEDERAPGEGFLADGIVLG